ncbi:MAG: MmcQ/YjbR family DNA-binding protein [Burkholderiales bacterium]
MTLLQLKRFCLALPAATQDVKWGEDQVFSVAGKMFAVVCQLPSGIVKVSFKVDTERFLEISDQPGFIPGPYFWRARAGCNFKIQSACLQRRSAP